MKRVIVVASVARNGVIGRTGGEPFDLWSLPGEGEERDAICRGHTVVLGRTTYDALGPVAGATTVVLTRDRSWTPRHEGVSTASGLLSALGRAALVPDGEVVVAGGAQVYAEAVPLASELVVTEVPAEVDGDLVFPRIEPALWEVTDRERLPGFQRTWYGRVS